MIILIVILVVLGLVLIGMYNGLIGKKNRVDEAWSDIEVQLKRRYDLIPNLVNTVKGFASQESSVLTKVTELRTAAMSAPANSAERAKDESMLSGALKSLFAVSEAYPDLKSNQNFLQLQKDVADTEDKLMASRRFFNSAVRDFNTALQTFPTVFFGRMLGFSSRQFFDIDEKGVEGQPVEVKF